MQNGDIQNKKKRNTIAKMLCVFVCSMLLFGLNGKVYIDPSVMTYVIQAVAGVAVAIGAAAGIYFRKAKKKINDKPGIDENRNREVEPDSIVVDDEDEN